VRVRTRVAPCLVVVAIVIGVGVQPSAQQEQRVVVHSNANLRKASSTQSDIVGHLEPGAELTVLPPGKKSRFWHVRASDGQEGWIYETLVHVAEEDDVPPPPPPPPAGISSSIDPTWEKPAITGSVLKGPQGTQPCPADGEAGGETETNRHKNRIDIATTYHPVPFGALSTLPFPDASTNRAKWTSEELQKIEPYEGIPVSVIGYIVAVKKQFGGAGEATNCHFSQEPFVDTHMALVEQIGQGEEKAVVVEPTPRFYAKHPSWLFSKLSALDHSPDPVRISGWILMDPVHKGHLGKYRMTLWEIHPITKIEVFKNGTWAEF